MPTPKAYMPAAAQDPAAGRVQRHHVDALHRLYPARGGLPDPLPVGRAAARRPEPRPVGERPAEDGPPAVDSLPVVRQTARRHGRDRGRREFRPYTREHEIPRVHDHEMPAAVARPVAHCAFALEWKTPEPIQPAPSPITPRIVPPASPAEGP